jgi:hypothetical protein
MNNSYTIYCDCGRWFSADADSMLDAMRRAQQARHACRVAHPPEPVLEGFDDDVLRGMAARILATSEESG